jgi:ATP-dependent protease ClpP protease subunit
VTQPDHSFREPTEAEIAAMVRKTLSEADKFDAERRKALAEALNAEHNAELARISRDQAVRQEKIIMAGNHHHHLYEFTTGVYEEPVSACLSQLAIWDRQDANCDMYIVIDSPGGSVIDGMHLFDQLSVYSKRPWDVANRIPGTKGTHKTTMTVRGYAASMAGILLQAADERVIGPESYLMIHEISSFTGGKIGEIKDEVKFMEKISQRVVEIFVARSGRITEEQFKKEWERKDWWLTSQEALDLGFVDRIG